MTALTIAGTTIRQDAAGRFFLNDLHRAAGCEAKHRPGEWLRNKQTQALARELGGADIPAGPVSTVNDGVNNGTFVARELVYSYAMWISPSFHLKVIRAYDALATAPAAPNPTKLTRMQLIELALQAEQERVALVAQVDDLRPKAEALDRIAISDGSFCLTDAAKTLQVQPRKFIAKLQQMAWIYRRPMGSGWLGYQDRITTGLLEHKVTSGDKSDGSEWTSTQVRVTAKGMARLAQVMASEGAKEMEA